MSAEIIIPKVGETTSEVRIICWLKEEGEAVEKGDALLEIETDKADIIVEAYADGILDRILVAEGEQAEAMQVVGMLRTGEEEVETLVTAGTAKAQPAGEAEEEPKEQETKEPATARSARESEAPAQKGRGSASPLARRLAKEHELDLEEVQGTGPRGLITADDVRAAAEPAALPQASAGEEIQVSRMRRAIGERMVRSKKTIPHFYVAAHIDMSEAAKLREELLPTVEEETGVRLSYTHLLIGALGLAAEQFPMVNATYSEGRVETHKQVNVGLAVALAEGLIVPVLKSANNKSLSQIAVETEGLVQRAREDRLKGENLEGATITLSNLGGADVEFFAAIVNPPQCAIVATGDIVSRPVAVDDEVAVHPTVFIVASGDHRVIDGKVLADFLHSMKEILENPGRLVA